MKYSDKERVQKIFAYTEKLLNHISENKITREEILKDYSLQWMITTPLYNIGEQVYYLSDEYKKAHDNIPWAMISGLRHRLVHDYEGTNWNIITEVIFEELPELMEQLKTII